jgi:4-hydroxybenzoate polyprenyltransferase
MIELIRRYRAERLPLSMALAVALLLATAAQTGGTRGFDRFPADAALAFLLFAQFRILDDLVDRRRDARRHPGRALVRAASVWPIRIAGLALAAATLAAGLVCDAPRAAFAGYLLLIAALFVFYAVRRGRTLVGDHLLLAKYPAFVWIIAASRSGGTLEESSASPPLLALSMLAIYLTACLYEALHDDDSPMAGEPTLVACEGLLLALALTVISLGDIQ